MAKSDHQPTPDEIRRGTQSHNDSLKQNRKNVSPSQTNPPKSGKSK